MSEYGISGADASARAEQDSAAVRRAMGGPSLAEFLLARFAEREALARAAIRDNTVRYGRPQTDDGCWSTSGYAHEAARVEGIGIDIYDEGGHTEEQAAHIAANDPAWVLAGCEAKRGIVELHTRDHECTAPGDGYAGVFAGDGSLAREFDTDDKSCPTLRLLALPYADHPDFRPEWRL